MVYPGQDVIARRRAADARRREAKKSEVHMLEARIKQLKAKVVETRTSLKLFNKQEGSPSASAIFLRSLLMDQALPKFTLPELVPPPTLEDRWFDEAREERSIVYDLLVKYAEHYKKLSKDEVTFLLQRITSLPEHRYTHFFVRGIIGLLRRVYTMQLSTFADCNRDATADDLFSPIPEVISFDDLLKEYLAISEMVKTMVRILTVEDDGVWNDTPKYGDPCPEIRIQVAKIRQLAEQEENDKMVESTIDPTCSSWTGILYF